MVKAIRDPGPEGVHLKENTLLTKLVELWVAVQQAGGDELIKYSHDEGRENSEEDIVERKGPGFEDDLTGKGILEGILVDRR